MLARVKIVDDLEFEDSEIYLLAVYYDSISMHTYIYWLAMKVPFHGRQFYR